MAVDVQAGSGADARVRVASGIERAWLAPTATRVEHRFNENSGKVQAFEVERYGELVLAERIVGVERETAARVIADRWLARGPSAADEQLLRRARFAGVPLDLRALVEGAALAARSLDAVDIASQLFREARTAIDRLAPATLTVPSGRAVRLEYREDGAVEAAVKLQELFGLADTPRLGPRREAVPVRPARAERPPGPGHARPSQLLGARLPGGEEGTARPIPEASVAGQSMERCADGANKEEGLGLEA